MKLKILLLSFLLLSISSLFATGKPMAYAVNGDLVTDPYAGYLDDGWWWVDRAIKTPSQNFAKPYIEGKINVLLIAPFSEARAVVELEQRFDFKVDMLMSASYKKLWSKNDYWVRRPYLKPFKKHEVEQLNFDKYDVIILGGLAWEDLFFDLKYNLLKAVSKGKGLVMMPYKKGKTSDLDTSPILKEVFSKPFNDNGYIVEGIPFDSMRGFGTPARKNAKVKTPEDIIKTYVFKQGKAVVLNYRPVLKNFLAPVKVHSDFMFDYYQALLGRAVIWASGKTAPLQIMKTSLDDIKTVKQSECHKIRLDISNHGSEKDYTFELLVRSEDKCYSTIISKSVLDLNIKKGSSKIELKCPLLPAGKVAIDIYIKAFYPPVKAKAVVDWCSRLLTVERDSIKIADIIEPDEIHNINANVPVTLKMIGKPQAGLNLDIICQDVYSRIIMEKSININDQSEIKVDVPLSRVIGNQVWLILKLMKQNNVVQYITKRIYRADTTIPDFMTLAWCGGFYSDDNTPWSRGAYKTVKKAGLNTIQPPLVFWQNSPNISDRGIIASDTGLKISPMICRLIAQKNAIGPIPKDNIGRGGFTDPKAFSQIMNTAANIAEKYAKMGAVTYNIGDENALHFNKENDLCRRPEVLEKFRKELKLRYNTLADLNREWQTEFKTWDDVVPDTLKDAKQRQCFASWADFRDFMETLLCDVHVLIKQALKNKGITNPKTSIDGLSDFRHCVGHDVTKLPKVVDDISPYDKNLSLSMVRDINPNSHPVVTHGVYSSRTGRYDSFLWEVLARGATASLFWNVYVGQNWTHGVMPDFRPAVPLADTGKDSLALNRGPARLIKKSTMIYSPVAILYSRPSIRAANFIDNGLGKTYSSMRVFVPGASEYFGLNPKFIDSSILKNSNEMKQFTVLILPYTQAISNDDAEAIKQFVKAGGTVIADSRPGIFSEHCGKRSKAILDDLFGVIQKDKSEPLREIIKVDWFDPDAINKQKGDSMLQDAAISGSVVKQKKQGSIVADAGIRLAGGKADMELPSSKTPIIIRHSYGKGEAILLNLKNSPELLPLWGKLLKENGITAPIKAFSASGHELHQFRYSIFKDSKATYVMLFEGNDMSATVSLPNKAFVYDVRNGKFLGHTDSIKLPTLSTPWMLALLPAETTKINLTIPKAAPSGADLKGTFKLNFVPDVNCFHVVCLRVFRSETNELRYYQQLINTTDGSGTFSIPFAMNEKPGTYTVRITDAATGASVEKQVLISKEKGN